MTRIFKHAALVIGGLGASLLMAGCSALGLGDGGLGSSRGSDTYDESRDGRSASGRYDDSTYDRSGSSSSGRYDSGTGRYDSTPGSNDYEERRSRRSADQPYSGQDRTYEERKAARQRDQYNNGY
jgi:hypothetical protein